MATDLDAAATAIEQFLAALGHDVGSDPELQGTGRRVAEAFANELLAGYAMDPKSILAETTTTRARGLVVLCNIHTTAICPHHLLPAPGVVHVGYLPGERVVGLGSLARLVDCHARRLVLQEDLGEAVVHSLVEHLGAEAAGIVVRLHPTCVSARGSRQHAAEAVTSAYAGAASAEFRRELLAKLPRP